jgi:serine/threonine protein kinase
MTTNPVVIGEGGYGCVHHPSLQCSDDKDLQKRPVDYTDKISKIMKKENALTELKEYETIARLDPQNQYYLGKPTACAVKNNPDTVKSIRKCTETYRSFLKLDDALLLLLKYGGKDLKLFAQSLHSLPDRQLKERAEHFWVDAHRLLQGLKLFHENQTVHHDLKPHNIVYDQDKRLAAFIDFGLMTRKKDILDLSLKSKNTLGINHWSFPYDSTFYNKKTFDYLKGKTPLENYKNFVYDIDIFGDEFKNINIQINHIQDNQELQKYMKKMKNRHYKGNATSYILNFLRSSHFPSLDKQYIEDTYMFYTIIQSTPHREFLSKSVDNFDIYGTGIAFLYVLKRCYAQLKKEFAQELYELFYRMITPDFSKRIHIDSLIQEYENILNKHVLADKQQRFVNGVVQSVSIPPPVAIPVIPPRILSMIVQTDTEQAASKVKVCPAGKVLNPFTGRCVKAAQAVKAKTMKNPVVKTCPEGKVLNPVSGRCIKVKAKTMKNPVAVKVPVAVVKTCPEGKVLNPVSGRCVKAPVAVVKTCPEGKVLNPVSGRCVKIKNKK